MQSVSLIVLVEDEANLAILTDALGETMRALEATESIDPIGLVLDPGDPGRYSWRFSYNPEASEEEG